ncbi:MAG: hypothetical protein QXU67_06400 [Candidatus Bathyarchaeia archaeon]
MLVEEYIPAIIADYIDIGRTVGLPLKTSSFISKLYIETTTVGWSYAINIFRC